MYGIKISEIIIIIYENILLNQNSTDIYWLYIDFVGYKHSNLNSSFRFIFIFQKENRSKLIHMLNLSTI